MSVQVTKEEMVLYKLRGIGNRKIKGWADVYIREWPGGGSIAIQSSYGQFNGRWGAAGESFLKFLISLEYHYFMKKTHDGRGVVASIEASSAEIRRCIIEARRERDIDAELARRAYDSVLTAESSHQFPDDYASELWENDDVMGILKNSPGLLRVSVDDPTCREFWDDAWSILIDTWKAELAQREVANVG